MNINVLMNHLNEIKLLLIENLKALITYPPPRYPLSKLNLAEI